MSLPTTRVPQTESSVNPPTRQDEDMWKRIVELEPTIKSAARRMAIAYNRPDDATELFGYSRMALIEKARKLPRLLEQNHRYIFQTVTRGIHDYYRKLFGSRLQYHVSSLDDLDEMLAGDYDALDTSERAEAVRREIETMDEECRKLVEAILESGDELCKMTTGAVNVNALARKVGRPKSAVYGDVARLRVRLAAAIA